MRTKFFIAGIIAVSLVFSQCKKDNNDDDSSHDADIPVALEATQIRKTNFLASWKVVDNATGYLIEVSTSPGFETFVNGFNSKDVKNADHAFVFGLEGSKDYYFRLQAYYNENISGYSNTIKVTTGEDDQLPNMDFEYWTQYPNYEEPSPYGIWATPNKLVDLLPGFYPAVTLKTQDAHSGNYAVKVVTDSVQGLPLLTGTLATGVFSVNLGNPVKSLTRGVPYYSKPYAFRGYYKYYPVNGDSCQVYAQLSYWDNDNKKRVLVGEASLKDITLEVPDYTLFNIPFDYYNEMGPDSLSVVFASSAGGDLFVGGVGSSLYIDDISMVFNQ